MSAEIRRRRRRVKEGCGTYQEDVSLEALGGLGRDRLDLALFDELAERRVDLERAAAVQPLLHRLQCL